MKLSIIIPVYNVEKYVKKCIESCMKQNINSSEYEIIVVNDGSKDNSLNIIKELMPFFSNVSLVSQKNKGLGAARNKGLSLSKGKYIWFIDSDDWIEENCLAEIINKLANIDVLAMGYIAAYDQYSKNKPCVPNLNARSGKELLTSSFIFPAQFYIYKKQFLENNKLYFHEGIYHEDFEFTPRMLFYAENISILNHPIYYFYKRPNSITTTANPKKSFDLIIIANRLSQFSETIDSKYKLIFNDLISLAINNALFNSFYMDKNTSNKLNNLLHKNKELFFHLKSSRLLKYRFEGFLFSLLPQHCVLIYKLMQKYYLKNNLPIQ